MMALPYDYYPAVLYAIDKISQGHTKTSACDEANINIATFDNYIKNDEVVQALYVEADQRGTDAMADALLTIDDHGIYGQSDPKMAKVISDNIKWLLSKRKSTTYGDKLVVEHNLTADKAITEALLAGRERATFALTDNIIDIEAITVYEPTEDELLAEILS